MRITKSDKKLLVDYQEGIIRFLRGGEMGDADALDESPKRAELFDLYTKVCRAAGQKTPERIGGLLAEIVILDVLKQLEIDP